MIKRIINLLVLLILLQGLGSCGRKITPSLSAITRGKGYDSATFDYVYVEAIRQKLLGNNADALNYLEHCAKLNPVSDAVYYQMARIVLLGGDINNGKKYAKKALELDPENIWYIMMLAGIYYQQQNLDSAIFYYEQAVKYYPEKEDLKLTLGNIYSENSRFDKASAIFESLDKKYGINETSTIANIRNLMRAEKFNDAENLILELLKENPDEFLYNGLLAEIYRGKGENEKAREVYKILIDRNPESPETQLSLCDFLINEKKYDELIPLLNTVIINRSITREDKISLFLKMIETKDLVEQRGEKLHLTLMVLESAYKGDLIIKLLRPELYINQGKLEDAAKRLEEVIIEHPDNESYFAWEKLLLVYLQAEDYVKLEERGKECATRFNRSFLAKMLYATALTENRKYDTALEEVRKAEILAGENKDMIMQVLSVRADIYYRKEDFDAAFRIFDEAIEKDNSDLTILNNYAYYLAERDLRLKEAEKMARQVIETEKDNSTFLDTYGWVLYKRGKLRDAEKVMQRVIESDDKPSSEWYEHMGFIKKKRKDCKSAIENWMIAIKLDNTKTKLEKEIEKCQAAQ